MTSPRTFALPLCAAALALLSACGGSSSNTSSCIDRLDRREYDSVINDAGCSNYEKASAYVAKAGFTWTKFLVSSAADNLSGTLGVGTLTQSSRLSDLQSSNASLSYYKKALDLTSGYASAGEKEVSLVASLGQLAYFTYGKIDTNLDGKLSSDEINNFTQVLSSPTGSNKVSSNTGSSTSTGVLQLMLSNGDVWLVHIVSSSPYAYCQKTNSYTGVMSVGTTLSCNDILSVSGSGTITMSANVSSARVIIFMSGVQQILKTGGDINVPLNFITDLLDSSSGIFTRLSKDIQSFGFNNTSDITTQVNKIREKIDNGGTCGSDASKAFALLQDIAGNAAMSSAADVSTSCVVSNKASYKAADLSTQNLVTLDIIKSIDSSAYSKATSNNLNLSLAGVRMVYCKSYSSGSCASPTSVSDYSNAYSDYYDDSSATGGVCSGLSQIRSLALDSSGKVKAVAKNDNIISFQELVCAQ